MVSTAVQRERKNRYMREYRRSKHGAAKGVAARKARRDLLHEVKSQPCQRCKGTFPPVCMDFHHRDPSTKEFYIGRSAGVIGLQRLLDEIEKCDVLCANCHRIVENEA